MTAPEVARQVKASEHVEKISGSYANEFKFQNSPVGMFGGIPDSEFNNHAQNAHETSQQQH